MSATWHPANGHPDHEITALDALDRAADARTDAGAKTLVDSAQVYATLAVAQEIRALHDLLDAALVNLTAAVEGDGQA